MIGCMVSLIIACMRQVKLNKVIDHSSHSEQSPCIATSADDMLYTFPPLVVLSYASSDVYKTSQRKLCP